MQKVAQRLGIMLRYAVRCSSMPMTAKADPALKGCKCLEVEGVETLDHELCLSWSKKQQDYHERLAEEGQAIAELLKSALK